MQQFEDTFTSHGFLTVCNHGGIEIEINSSNDSVRYRFNYGDPEDKDNMEIFETEIIYEFIEDDPTEATAGFKHGDTFYSLNEFMRT